jgi:hypothetical protein
MRPYFVKYGQFEKSFPVGENGMLRREIAFTGYAGWLGWLLGALQ